MSLENLQDLFVEQLQDVYNAENQLVKALPQMAKASNNTKLRTAFTEHLEQTKGHVKRLEQVFKEIDMEPKGKTCKAMQGLVEEGEEMIKEKAESEVKDAGLIAAAQRIEHYEIAAYGTLRTYAETLGHKSSARLLQMTLDEEGEADKLLTSIATSVVNTKAAMGEDNGKKH